MVGRFFTILLIVLAFTFIGFIAYRAVVFTPGLGELNLLAGNWPPLSQIHGVVNLIAVDTNGDGKLTNQSVMMGEDGFIIIVPKDKKKALVEDLDVTVPLYSFNGLETLAQYDLNQDGHIDAEDEIYSHLFLAFMNMRQQTVVLVPIEKSKIHRIVYYHGFLQKELDGDPDRFHDFAGHLVMGSLSGEGRVKIVTMPYVHLKDLRRRLLESNLP